MLPGVGDGADALDGVVAGAGVHQGEFILSCGDPWIKGNPTTPP